MKMKSDFKTVYIVKSEQSGMVYIGCTSKPLPVRLREHFAGARSAVKRGMTLSRAGAWFLSYTPSELTIESLAQVAEGEDWRRAEDDAIKAAVAQGVLVVNSIGGGGGDEPGNKKSNEHKRNLSVSLKDALACPDAKERQRTAQRVAMNLPERKRQQSASMKASWERRRALAA